MAKKKKKTQTNPPPTEHAQGSRKARGVNADIKASNLRRLKRVEGQVRGVAAMVEEDRYCADILDQITAVQNAMRAVAREVLRNHLEHCVSQAFNGTPQDAECMRDELLRLFDKRMY